VAHIDRGDGEVPRHVAIVPLRFHEEVGGVLLLADKEMRGGSATGFDDDDDGMLESFDAGGIGAAQCAPPSGSDRAH